MGLLAELRNKRKNKQSPHMPREWKQPPEPSADVLSRCVVLHSNQHGFGDGIAASWLSEATRGSERPIVHYARDSKAQLLHALGQYVTQEPRDEMLAWGPVYSVEIAHRGKVNRLDCARRVWKVREKPVCPSMPIPDEVTDWAARQGGDVLICPHTMQRCRAWPTPYYLDLIDMLAQQGLKSLVMLGGEDNAYRAGDSYVQLDWRCSLALMRSVRLVIGNDSAPLHLATVAGTPAISLLGPSGPSLFAHAPNVHGISSDLDCVHCWWNPPYRTACQHGCQALYQLVPSVVADVAMELLQANLIRT